MPKKSQRLVSLAPSDLPCGTCKELLPVEQFRIIRHHGNVVYEHRCKECENKRQLTRRRSVQRDDVVCGVSLSITKNTQYNLTKKYGLTIGEFIDMIVDCEGACEICSKPFADQSDIRVDHCHTTGRVRGLLCSNCNFGMSFVDNQEWLMNALKFGRKK